MFGKIFKELVSLLCMRSKGENIFIVSVLFVSVFLMSLFLFMSWNSNISGMSVYLSGIDGYYFDVGVKDVFFLSGGARGELHEVSFLVKNYGEYGSFFYAVFAERGSMLNNISSHYLQSGEELIVNYSYIGEPGRRTYEFGLIFLDDKNLKNNYYNFTTNYPSDVDMCRCFN
jgi:hypothetical protein